MEPARDQVSQDHAHRPWMSYTEVEQGALLVELSASLRRRLQQLELGRDVAGAYRVFAHTARCAGQALVEKHRIPFVPDPPFRWDSVALEQVGARAPEITAWAASTVVDEHQPVSLRHAALDLSQASQQLERQLERSRTR